MYCSLCLRWCQWLLFARKPTMCSQKPRIGDALLSHSRAYWKRQSKERSWTTRLQKRYRVPLPDHRLWVIYSCKSLFDEILIQDPSRSISVFCERRMKKKFRRLECLVSKQPPFTDTSCKHRKRKPRDRRRSHWQTSPSFSSCLFSSAKRTTCNHLNTHEPTFRKGCANNPKDFRRRLRFENAHSRR